MTCPITPDLLSRPPFHTLGLRTPPLLPWVCLTSPPLSTGAGGQRNQLREASMENGERKKLSFTSPDEDRKEENSPYRLCSTFAVSLTQRSRHGGLGIEEEAQTLPPTPGSWSF